MFKFLLPVLLAVGCAPQIKEVRVEIEKPCLTQAPPTWKGFESYEMPKPVHGMDENGKEIIGVSSVVSMDSFIAFGTYVTSARAWMTDAYTRCHAAK